MLRIISLLLIITPLLVGYYSDKPIMTFGTGGTRYVVHDLKGNERGNILLKSTNKGLQGDLIYRGYEKEVEKYLLQNGFKTTLAEFAKKFKDGGATILGGCCETRPAHIKAISSI